MSATGERANSYDLGRSAAALADSRVPSDAGIGPLPTAFSCAALLRPCIHGHGLVGPCRCEVVCTRLLAGRAGGWTWAEEARLRRFKPAACLEPRSVVLVRQGDSRTCRTAATAWTQGSTTWAAKSDWRTRRSSSAGCCC